MASNKLQTAKTLAEKAAAKSQNIEDLPAAIKLLAQAVAALAEGMDVNRREVRQKLK